MGERGSRTANQIGQSMKSATFSCAAPDCYEILGVSSAASQEEIKGAFRRLALIWHPDHNGSDTAAAERFKVIRRAYELLVNPGRRRRYDAARSSVDPYGAAPGRCREGTEEAAETAAACRVDELLREAFGIGEAGHRQPNLGNDLRFDLQVDGPLAVRGGTEAIAYDRLVPCSRCAGAGRTAGRTCGSCGGDAVEVQRVRLQVRVPPGAVSGERLRLAGAGDQLSPNHGAADLLIHLLVVDQDAPAEVKGKV